MTKTLWFALAVLTAHTARARESDSTTATRCQASAQISAYPTFCSIPPTPTDVRDAKAFKAAVVDTRQAGRRLWVKARSESSSLPIGGAETFSAAARAQVMAPPSANDAEQLDTKAFEAKARLRVPPPRRPRS